MYEGSAPPGAVETSAARRRLPRLVAGTAGALGLAVGVAVGVTTLAGAATDPGSGSTTTTTPPAAGAAPAPAPGPGGPGGRFGGRGKGPGGFGGGIHGEFVVPGPNGGYETLDSQSGQVTDVSPTSITVKSEDNFEKTYVVDAGTVVDAGRDGIGSVTKGDTVDIQAVVTDKTAKAVEVQDITSLKSHRSTWAPQRPRRGADAPGSTPPTTTG